MYTKGELYDPNDLWLDSRNRTAMEENMCDCVEGKPVPPRAPSTWDMVKSFSFRGAPVRHNAIFDAFAIAADRAVVVDLNKYRPGADLKKLKEEIGVQHVILRMFGPLQFVYENWKLTEDPTYRSYYDQAKALGMTVGGYFIYSAGIDQQDYAGSEILLNYCDVVMQGGQYKPDYMIVDDEVNTWWQNGAQVTATPHNQVTGLKYLMPKIWRYFKLVPMHYSARWFMNQYKLEYTTWFDNVNNTPEGKTMMNWYAWYLNVVQNSGKVYNHQNELLSDLPTYTSDQLNAYLSLGSYSPYDLHQLSSNWITPFVTDTSGKPIGVDVSVSRKSAQLFFQDMLIDITPPDTVAPSVPMGLMVQNMTPTSFDIVWLPASDNTGVAGYSVFVSGNQIGTTAVAKYTMPATPATTYLISVDAFDAAGNHSHQTVPLSVTTPVETGKGCSPIRVS